MSPRAASRRQRPGRPGQALVEFVLVMPILLLLVAGVIEFGRAWQTYQTLTEATRSGGRMGTLPGSSVADVIRAVQSSAAAGGLTVPADDVTVQGIGAAWDTVAVVYPYRFVFLQPLIGWTSADATVHLHSTMIMRNE